MKEKLEFVDNIAVMDLETLQSTYHEYNAQGEPAYNGILHFALINQILDLCKKHGLQYKIEEIFAAQNKMKGADGVVVNKQLQQTLGEDAVGARALRRVFTTIAIEDHSDSETNTTIAISHHQMGIQVAIGPNVRICHNQCILSPERTVTTYGDRKIKTLDNLFSVVDSWLGNLQVDREADMAVIETMKDINTTYDDVMRLVGYMTAIRVGKDSSINAVRERINRKTAPLTQGQISAFAEKYLQECIKTGTTDMSLWDVYNLGTELHKPNSTDLPNIIPQNLSLIETIKEVYL